MEPVELVERWDSEIDFPQTATNYWCPNSGTNLGGRNVESSARQEGCGPSEGETLQKKLRKNQLSSFKHRYATFGIVTVKIKSSYPFAWALFLFSRFCSLSALAITFNGQLVHQRKVSLIAEKIRSLVSEVSHKCTTFSRLWVCPHIGPPVPGMLN